MSFTESLRVFVFFIPSPDPNLKPRQQSDIPRDCTIYIVQTKNLTTVFGFSITVPVRICVR